MPKLDGILETALYVTDMSRARRFFETVMGLEAFTADHRFTAYDAGSNTVLLLFLEGATQETVTLPDGMGTIPPHDGTGRVHLALAIEADELAAWEARLADHDIAIEGRTHWPRGGESLYFRDPDGHLLELATPGVWPNY
ncbi:MULTISPECIES: VOC family protein [unclassified Modicisalibacter]|uniref:VOC family protein n=1 Tax=unclassified Modicisalibacter TaxID=2679913 RepID=UPI001CCB8CCA|nr:MULTISPECIES: VOC family protein [unclassified Modicisalibacter]MBZ9558200.1 VOC family protein [Modicisalibacter sp. R2A 31.J]MBZ9573132.1 VOC family protein [Modicisalibacter sp. MOD 31.J]